MREALETRRGLNEYNLTLEYSRSHTRHARDVADPSRAARIRDMPESWQTRRGLHQHDYIYRSTLCTYVTCQRGSKPVGGLHEYVMCSAHTRHARVVADPSRAARTRVYISNHHRLLCAHYVRCQSLADPSRGLHEYVYVLCAYTTCQSVADPSRAAREHDLVHRIMCSAHSRYIWLSVLTCDLRESPSLYSMGDKPLTQWKGRERLRVP